MNIVFVSPSFPNRLHRIRATNIITTLSKNHAVHLVTLSWGMEKDDLERMNECCASVTVIHESKWIGRMRAVAGLFGMLPIEVAYYNSSRMRTAVRNILTEKSIDVVYVKRLRSVIYLPSNISIPVIIDSTDAMSMFYERAAKHISFPTKILYQLEAKRYARFEKIVAKKYSNWVFCSTVDADFLKKKIPYMRTMVLPNGVDTTYFAPSRFAQEKNTLLISGLLDKFVNYEAAEYFVHDIFPKIKKMQNAATLYLVGPAKKSIRSLASEDVIVTGRVDDVREYISRARVVCCPVRTGSGTRNKILQAWAMGRPVVSTTQGAEGLEYRDGVDIVLADTPESFAEAVIRVLTNTSVYESLVKGGTVRVQNQYAMDVIQGTIEEYLRAVQAVDY